MPNENHTKAGQHRDTAARATGGHADHSGQGDAPKANEAAPTAQTHAKKPHEASGMTHTKAKEPGGAQAKAKDHPGKR